MSTSTFRDQYDVIVLGSGPGGEGASMTVAKSGRLPGAANTLMYFIDTTFDYPTMAEACRVAALNGLNRVN